MFFNQDNGSQASPSLEKLVFLGIIALALAPFPPLTILAPAPLALGILMFGRQKGLLLSAVYVVVLFVFATLYPQRFPLLEYISLGVGLLAFLIAELITRNAPAKKILIFSGSISYLGIGVILAFATLFISDFSIENALQEQVAQVTQEIKTSGKLEELKTQGGEQTRILLDSLENPKELVNRIIAWLPKGVFMGLFFSIWACLYIILRNAPLWKKYTPYSFGTKDLLNFRVPDFLVWPLILALALTLGGEYVLGQFGVILGDNLLYMLGIFYFFQGFGVLVEYLDHFKIVGFLRGVMLLFTLLLASKLLFVLGIFDHWLNFRKFLKNKEKN
jgi:uncharacterized protein YybS (DUF2232 family)